MTRIYVYNKTREIVNGGRVLPAKGGDQNVYNAFRAFSLWNICYCTDCLDVKYQALNYFYIKK